MRYFPRAARRRTVAATSVVALSVGVLSSPYPAALADDLEDKKREVQRELKAARGDLGESSKELRQATVRWRKTQERLIQARERLSRVEGKVRAAEARDAALQQQLDQAQVELEQAQKELKQSRGDMRQQQEKVGDVIDEFYTKGDPALLTASKMLEGGGISEITRRMEARDVMVEEQEDAYAELRATEVLLEVRERRVTEARDRVRERRREAAEHLERMEGLQADVSSATTQVRQRVNAKRQAREAAHEARQRDAAVLADLKQEKERISGMLRRRAAAARRRAQARQSGGGSVDARSDSGGFLGEPVDGYVTDEYGYRTHPIYGYRSMHDGIDYGSGCGAPMVASADGRVVSRYFQTAYGNRLIIDHGYQRGVGLATIYNHAQRYTVSPGEHVERGEVIGYMGSTGWSTGCHLHFTVTENGEPVNPRNWL